MPKAAMFNARIETVDTSAAFKDAFRSTRCLVPADDLYEMDQEACRWRQGPMAHLPARTGAVLVRGLWAHNKTLAVTSCTIIITAAATEPMRQLHDRQPVILDPAVYDAWLDPATPAADAKALLGRNLDGELQFHRVSRAVNSTKDRAGSSDMIEPVNPL